MLSRLVTHSCRGLSHSAKNVALFQQTVTHSCRGLSHSAKNFEQALAVRKVVGPYSYHSVRISSPYLIDRTKGEDGGELPDTVLTLGWPFPIPPCPEEENPKEWEDVYSGAEVYLLGTVHHTNGSKEDVKKVIERVRPDVVMVELCSFRKKQMEDDPEFGGEFRDAYRAAEQIPCPVVLGDRPIGVSLLRQYHAISPRKMEEFVSRVNHVRQCMTIDSTEDRRIFDKITEEIEFLNERIKRRDLQSTSEREIIVTERDKYMTYHLQELLINQTLLKREEWRNNKEVKWQSPKIVCVVGLNHLPGMVGLWGTQIDISELSRVPDIPDSVAVKMTKIWNQYSGKGRDVFRRFIERISP